MGKETLGERIDNIMCSLLERLFELGEIKKDIRWEISKLDKIKKIINKSEQIGE